MADEVRDGLKYTKEHEWIKIKEDIAVIGITDHAQAELTDIVLLELLIMLKQNSPILFLLNFQK